VAGDSTTRITTQRPARNNSPRPVEGWNRQNEVVSRRVLRHRAAEWLTVFVLGTEPIRLGLEQLRGQCLRCSVPTAAAWVSFWGYSVQVALQPTVCLCWRVHPWPAPTCGSSLLLLLAQILGVLEVSCPVGRAVSLPPSGWEPGCPWGPTWCSCQCVLPVFPSGGRHSPMSPLGAKSLHMSVAGKPSQASKRACTSRLPRWGPEQSPGMKLWFCGTPH
jgi:hypothetical protein